MKNLMKTAAAFLLGIQVCACSQVENKVSPAIPSDPEIEANIRQIGRASCRERVYATV